LFSLGDPALDIGNFIAHLSELGLREHHRAEFFSDREEALVNRYVELNPGISAGAIKTYRTLTLARHIFISTQFPERRHATERLLAWCERELYGTRMR
jgi:aminoglycoside phosphotransferase (APT) family kinase protein